MVKGIRPNMQKRKKGEGFLAFKKKTLCGLCVLCGSFF